MFNFYDFVDDNPTFKQFKVDELLFTAYDCPIEVERLDYWTKKNYFVYTIRGSIKWKTPRHEYLIRVGDAVFVKKASIALIRCLIATTVACWFLCRMSL